MYGVAHKQLEIFRETGGDQILTWAYTIKDGPPDEPVSTTIITGPSGEHTEIEYYYPDEKFGRMERSKIISDAHGNIMSTVRTDYELEESVVSRWRTDTPFQPDTTWSPHNVIRKEATQTDTYTTEHTYNTDQSSSSYSFGHPVRTVRSSSVPGDTITTETTYVFPCPSSDKLRQGLALS